MADLIDRQAAVKAILKVPDGNWSQKRYAQEIKKLQSVDIREQLDNAYAHGATEAEAKYRAILDTMPQVVRCKDCKWWHDWDGECYGNGNMGYGVRRKADDFCSWGERKDG